MSGRRRSSPCRWLERDETGRPRCEHGWAFKAGRWWRCRDKHYRNCRAYGQTEAGRAFIARSNANPATKSRKELYELTRIRVS